MKIIEVDEELYQYIASQTQSIGESASDILRHLLNLPALPAPLTKFELVPDERRKFIRKNIRRKRALTAHLTMPESACRTSPKNRSNRSNRSRNNRIAPFHKW